MTGLEHDERDPSERRKSLRIPVPISVRINISDEGSGFLYTASMLNYSTGGVGLAWDSCEVCSGYLPGGIAPDCLFSPYNVNIPGSRDLRFHLELGNFDQDINFKGKAVYTLKEDGIEKVGIIFTGITPEMFSFMRKVF